MPRLLIVCPYPHAKAPSQRFRFEQYMTALQDAGFTLTFRSFWSHRHWPAIYRKGALLLKIYATIEGFARRFALLLAIGRYDFILIHREATPVGPPWWEWIAARGFRKKIIFDLDDATWLPNNSAANEKLVRRFKAHSKTDTIIGLCSAVTAGNGFLAAFAKKYCKQVHIVPTTIDTGSHHNRVKTHQRTALPTLGWTGSHSTLRQLIPIFPLLEKLHQRFPFRFLVICDEAPRYMPPFAEWRKWSKDREIEDLLELDAGVMPLYDTDWERGKCGFKALQYMSLGIPAVVSGVGVNTEIVHHSVDGFVCEALPIPETETWSAALQTLLCDASLRNQMGAAARIAMEQRYSVKAWQERYVDIFQKVLSA